MTRKVSSTLCTRFTATLHLGIEVLHAEARAVESDTRVLGDVAGCTRRGSSSIEKSRSTPLLRRKWRPRVCSSAPMSAGRMKFGSTAAQMDLDHFAVATEQRTEHRNLALQALEVGACARRVARDDAIATAVEARD